MKERKAQLYQELKELKDKIFSERQRLEHLKEIYWSKRREYEEIDRQLAMIDGRRSVVVAKRKEVKVKLTMQQLHEVAKELGVDLNEE